MKKYAVIVAGGAGTRMGAEMPKQFLELCGRPILWYTLNTFLSAYDDMPVVLVAPEHHLGTPRAVVATTAFPTRIEVVSGGATRFESVRNGLATIPDESVIFVHDG